MVRPAFAVFALSLAACAAPEGLPALGPGVPLRPGACGSVDVRVCDGGWAFECAPAADGCAWRTHGAPCRGEPEAREPLVPGRACGR